ncbi:hypothetical protein SO802_013659 [Lithocarpus litseifolius]|uniref:Pectinesterase inhibitor domain-containing protein n=1 Tax=Lithocarpus litseifolius TaxID=425828 RepID=A0AAW2D8V3_9ROSI
MNPISSLVFVLLLTVFPTLILCQTPLIIQACNYTIYKFQCLDTLQPDPEAHSATTLKTLVKVTIKHSETKASDIDNQIIKLIRSTNDAGLKTVLNGCSDNYLTVVEKIQAAGVSLADNNYYNVKEWINEATTNIVYCNRAFQGKPFKSPISDSATLLSQLCTNALSILPHV